VSVAMKPEIARDLVEELFDTEMPAMKNQQQCPTGHKEGGQPHLRHSIPQISLCKKGLRQRRQRPILDPLPARCGREEADAIPLCRG
jgi:hypothetical protein